MCVRWCVCHIYIKYIYVTGLYVFLYHRKMIQLQVHLQLPCYDFCFLY